MGCGRHLGDFAAGRKQRIDEAAFARFDLADDHKHKRLVEAIAQVADGLGQFFVTNFNGEFVQVLDDLVKPGATALDVVRDNG
jgi:hypothetical protein